MSEAVIKEAVKFLRDCQATHDEWAAHFTKFPGEEEAYRDIVGSREEHERLSRQYLDVIELLEGKLYSVRAEALANYLCERHGASPAAAKTEGGGE